MKTQDNFLFIDKATEALTSNQLKNKSSDNLTIQVSGTFTSAEFNVQGKTDINSNEWVNLSVVNVSDYSVVSNVTKKGIYTLSVEGFSFLRVNLTAVSGGNITVFGRLTMGE